MNFSNIWERGKAFQIFSCSAQWHAPPILSKHLKGHSLPPVRNGFGLTKDFVVFLFLDSFHIQWPPCRGFPSEVIWGPLIKKVSRKRKHDKNPLNTEIVRGILLSTLFSALRPRRPSGLQWSFSSIVCRQKSLSFEFNKIGLWSLSFSMDFAADIFLMTSSEVFVWILNACYPEGPIRIKPVEDLAEISFQCCIPDVTTPRILLKCTDVHWSPLTSNSNWIQPTFAAAQKQSQD